MTLKKGPFIVQIPESACTFKVMRGVLYMLGAIYILFCILNLAKTQFIMIIYTNKDDFPPLSLLISFKIYTIYRVKIIFCSRSYYIKNANTLILKDLLLLFSLNN